MENVECEKRLEKTIIHMLLFIQGEIQYLVVEPSGQPLWEASTPFPEPYKIMLK